MSIAVFRTDRPSRGGEGWATQAVDLLLCWQERARERRHLAELPDYLLKDVGLNRSDVEREAGKPVWRR
ncbi:DUF1127 domain-containing protein [Arenibaculum pallidiluteum]|uniref:DUF1127 domain-containing protein n=1 Tax=Arenibaculum pallidiluteum TaxID=2812559 RepID=UPI001A95B902|nr:DUF1127 domain-containing protein [Arenibaculum pallidiluteum]